MVQEDLKFLYYKFYIELVKINKQINKMLAAKVITDTALKSTSSDLFWSSFFPDFPAFGLNKQRYSVSLRSQPECGKQNAGRETYTWHCLEKVRIWNYSSPYFSRIFPHSDWKRRSVRMREKPGKMRTRITPNIDSFYAVWSNSTKIAN